MTPRAAEPRASDVILERLKLLHPKSIDLVLDRIERLLTALGNPETRLPPVFHVAGTNGKGSTVAFLRAMLEASGKRVHVYTSPHLVRFHERIRLAGKLIDEDELSMLLDECERANGGEPITFFEITTAAAFLAMTRHAADAVILEVGLGGRLDATNVIKRPAATLITPIGLDHQQFLGNTLREIAGEKAGILKRGVRALIGPQADEVRMLLEARADRIDAPLLVFGQDFSAHEEHGRMVYQDERGLIDLPMPRLVGRHQLSNAALAIAALRHTPGFSIIDGAAEKGLTGVEWPARLQRLVAGPLIDASPDGAEIWLDGGHNPHAAAAIAQAMADLEERSPRPLYLICGMLTTKDARGFLSHFRGLARHVTTIEIPGEGSYGAGALYDIARSIGIPSDPAELIDDAMAQIEARSQITAGEPPPRVLVCGSLYLAGKVLSENR